MCGIVGYIGDSEKKSILLEGLKELEYRGYDSTGLAVLSNDRLEVFKTQGKLENLTLELKNKEFLDFGVSIAHTRWATHGKPSSVNAHPHFTENLALVHNGIIENYAVLKKELEEKGHAFLSQTDTEVIAHLLEETLKSESDLLKAFEKSISLLKGSYAVLMLHKRAKESLFYAKSSSPLIVGKGKEGVFFASSLSVLAPKVDQFVILEENSVGQISLENFKDLKNIENMKDYAFEDKDYSKGDFRNYLEKEIYEQHSSLLECLEGRLEALNVYCEIDPKFLENVSEITLCSCGSSYHASLASVYLFERLAKIRARAILASEYRYAHFKSNPNELFIAISQSGETADTLEALKLAKAQGLKTISLCNAPFSMMSRISDHTLLIRAGVERSVASTKAFSSQVMLLWLLSVYIGKQLGTISKEEERIQAKNMLNSVNAMKVEPKLHEKIKRLSKRYLHGHGFFYIGRDVFYPLALEGALKLKEISYLHAEGYASAEMKHGPIALVDSNLFTIALLSKHLLFDKTKSNIEELSARDSTICVLSSEILEIADDFIQLGESESYMEEFFRMNLAMQLLALEIAMRLNHDVDHPRNLAKSVTVE